MEGATMLSPLLGEGSTFCFPRCTQRSLFLHEVVASFPLKCWAPFQSHPESLSQGGEGWNEGEAHWAFCEAPGSTNVGQPGNQTQDPSQPGGPF